ncbi:hypothetical protein B0T10DRAFT_463716 [Thelonectria olida]|uniref:Uncharacterized protein n=1 Tax=Thelonectria olida TaxID=1576542 RepID=A0A9P9AKC5_9HYPO|nr:hypothetical protein B0T10DRAFT_463716 [Thelonectria olida]
MLPCRLDPPQSPTKSNDGDRVPSSDIQSFCATKIVSLASDEFKSSTTFWAPLPYAVSLATSVAYQSLRNSTIAYTRKRAYPIFHRGCEILDELSKAFRSARMMARLAMDTLQEVERVSANKTRSQVPERSRDGAQSTNTDIVSGCESSTADYAAASSQTTLDLPNLRPADVTMQMSNLGDLSGDTSGTASLSKMSILSTSAKYLTLLTGGLT